MKWQAAETRRVSLARETGVLQGVAGVAGVVPGARLGRVLAGVWWISVDVVLSHLRVLKGCCGCWTCRLCALSSVKGPLAGVGGSGGKCGRLWRALERGSEIATVDQRTTRGPPEDHQMRFVLTW